MLRDTHNSYGWVSVALHWIGAAAILALWLLGNTIHDAPDRDARIAAIWRHVGVAMVLYLVLAARIGWRLAQPRVEKPDQAKALSALARLSQWLLLAAIAFQLVTGPITVWTIGVPIRVFDWFAIPGPFGRDPELHDLLGQMHKIGAWVIAGAVALHILGALKHAVMDRDGTLMRIIRPGTVLKRNRP